MGKIISFHPLELKPGADESRLRRLVVDDLVPIYSRLRQTAYLMKGDMGKLRGQYVLVIEIESADERDRVYGSAEDELVLSEDAQALVDQGGAVLDELDALLVAFPSPSYTDYEVIT